MWPFRKSRKAKERAYQDAGMKLVARLVSELTLPDWGSDLLPTYSAEEIEAIANLKSRALVDAFAVPRGRFLGPIFIAFRALRALLAN